MSRSPTATGSIGQIRWFADARDIIHFMTRTKVELDRAIGAAILCGVLAASCANQRAVPLPTRGELRRANVLLVTIDTLRRDRVGAYGNDRGLTPALDSAAAAGIRFTHAYSHAPMTLPAHASILTGLIPPHHHVRANGSFRLDDRVPTLAAVLKSAGYRTGAFVGAFVLDARFGLNSGFDEYDDRYSQQPAATSFAFVRRPASAVVGAAEPWILRSAASPWFAWVHLYDSHAPYEAPPAFRSGRSAYDAAVAYTDAELGAFLDRLRRARALDRTLLILTSDHGESLGDHGESTHGLFAYDATLAIPLIVSGPSIGRAVVDTPVAHADIVPTVLDLLQIAAPAPFDGRSLAAPPSDRAIYFEALDANLTRDWAPLTGVVRTPWKYIELPMPELYDTDRDPTEAHNLAATDRSTMDTLSRVLNRIDALSPAGVAPATAGPVTADAEARLRALGYVSGTRRSRPRPYADADDPKRLVSLNERFDSAIGAFNEGRSAAALTALLGVLHDRPDFLSARTSAAAMLLTEHQARAAADLLTAAPPSQRNAPELLAKLGVALREAGDLAGAAGALETARREGDDNPELLDDLGVVYARLGRAADARAMFQTLLARAPNAAGTWYNLGLLELDRRNAGAAADAFRHAVTADAAYGEAWTALGAALVDRDPHGAIDAWRRAERLRPHDYDLLFNLGMVIASGDRPREAAPYLERFIREAPRDRYASDIERVRATLARIR
jgi:arylsulfatase A-like enzyme/Flp pilus assembly protein TadD